MITSAPFPAAGAERVGCTDMLLTQMVIDGPEFARRANRAGGQVVIASLERIAEFLAGSDGVLVCELQGGRGDNGSGHFELLLKVSGVLQLRCQRCLDALQFPLHIDKRLRLVNPDAQWPEEVEDESFDAIEASREMAVGSLIEDEVLLALPISPRHEICGTPRMKDTKQDASPFAVLRKLKSD